ncbi:MAG: chromosome segregation protein SMC [Tissierellia bacterium]|nr:chromosome segregation protein SMC [Tissierellia bacterium]
MILKELKIKGFKSFLHNTKLSFLPGITAIVGPNGSGKSNISDAIRWVLGESSIKNLRGNRMEDVIFTGTEDAKPVGYAEVSMTLTDCHDFTGLPYDEITVCRRMFRDGESEFLINKNKVRLKDIRELFMDTGIGRDGYSIIGQGQIDEVLSNRPEDRRSIFEEASGISKFKFKKEEALRKISRAEEDLERIHDRYDEILSQYEKLLKEKERTETYNTFIVEKNSLELDILYFNLLKFRSSYLDYEKQISSIQESKVKAEDAKKSLFAKREEIEKKISSLDDDLREIQDQKLLSTKKFSEIRTQYLLSKEKIKNNQEEERQLNEQIKTLQSKIDMYIKDSNRLEIEISSLKDAEEVEFGDEEKKRMGTIQRLLEELDQQFENEQRQALLMNQETQLAKNKKIHLETILRNVEDEILSLQKQIESKTAQVLDAEEKGRTMADDLEAILSKKQKAEEESHHLASEINKLQMEQSKINYELQINENLLRGDDLYYSPVKFIKNTFSSMDGIHGLVVECIETEKEYIKAIEVLLGSKLQYVVTKDQATAKTIIEEMKRNKVGRATFLPMELYKKQYTLPSLKVHDGCLGYAIEFVKIKPGFEALISHLFRDVILYDTLDNAIKSRKKHTQSIITLEGDFLHHSGSITGGDYKKKTVTMLAVKENIKQLLIQKENISDTVNKQFLEQEENKHQLSELHSSFSTASKLMAEHRNLMISMELQKESMKERLEERKTVLIGYKNELTQITEKEKNEIDQNDIERKLEDSQRTYVQRKQNLSKEYEELRNVQQKKEIFQLKYESARKRMDELLLLKEEGSLELEKLQDRLESVIKSLMLSKEEDSRLFEELKAEETEEHSWNGKLNEIIDKKEAIHGERDAIERNFEEIQEEVQLIGQKLTDIEIKKARMDENLSLLAEEIQSVHHMSVDAFVEVERDTKNITKKKTRVSEIQTMIEEMGNINLNAISEFHEVLERKEFYEKQVSDIEESLQDLNSIVTDINRQMRKQFNVAFKDIRTNFKEVYEQLFNGGTADLTLTDESDPLHSGISIVAMPPGKKPQSLSLLSGGEKTLTAIALLFAFLKLKPSPFCILDEIDAALDDANIMRYIEYLRKLSKDSQFLIITHRKLTLEVADCIYGVCMRKKGISELISMKMEDYMEEDNVSVV